jgi:hypothetical protein
MQVIVYKQDNGVPAVVVPTQEALSLFGIEAIAAKDVPAGKPYKIMDSSELPLSVPQEAWAVNEADLTDGVGSESSEFPPELLAAVYGTEVQS